jgi:rubrerythrin
MSLGLLDLLQHAVKMEEDGRAYYLDVAGRTGNALARQTFQVLAGEEDKHVRYFQEYYDAMGKAEGWPDIAEIMAEAPTAAQRAENVFTQAAKETAVSGDEVNLTEAYNHAMDLERKSITFYQDMIAQAGDDRVAQFLDFVIGQERGHLDILSHTLDMLDNPDAWYFDQEGWIVEG